MVKDHDECASKAMVRHKRVTLASLEKMLLEDVEEADLFGYPSREAFVEDHPDGEADPFGYKMDLGRKGSASKSPKEESTILEAKKDKNKEKKKKIVPLKQYSSSNEIIVAKTAKDVARLCVLLRQAVDNDLSRRGTCTSAVGLDVEYCTLEEDIRDNLPAMLQIAAPGGPSGLIWLDKLNEHGRLLFTDPQLEPLFSLLSDASVLKVGVGVLADAKNLAAWCGETNPQLVGSLIGGVTELSSLPDPRIRDKISLRVLCQRVLGQNLPKRKYHGKKQGCESKKAFWRADQLTKDMKMYAAHDASCALDIWFHANKEAHGAASTNVTFAK